MISQKIIQVGTWFDANTELVTTMSIMVVILVVMMATYKGSEFEFIPHKTTRTKCKYFGLYTGECLDKIKCPYSQNKADVNCSIKR